MANSKQAKRDRQKRRRALRDRTTQTAGTPSRMRIVVILAAVLVIVTAIVIVALNRMGTDDNKKMVSNNECPEVDGSSKRQTKFTEAPPVCIDKSKTYTAIIETDVGNVKVALNTKDAPNTVNNFVNLARYHFYDGLTFHRVIPDFVIQGGDPQGTGMGGPGYKIADELPKATPPYKTGSLAMANSGANTSGSQFFIVTTDAGAGGLQPLYSLFGEVGEGFDIVQKIAADGSADGKPKVVHKIVKITIVES